MITSKTIVLILSIVMPQDVPDVTHIMRMQSFDKCWSAAKEFTERDLSDAVRDSGAVGLKATCGYQEMPSSEH
jgi:hypothetical protein